ADLGAARGDEAYELVPAGGVERVAARREGQVERDRARQRDGGRRLRRIARHQDALGGGERDEPAVRHRGGVDRPLHRERLEAIVLPAPQAGRLVSLAVEERAAAV